MLVQNINSQFNIFFLNKKYNNKKSETKLLNQSQHRDIVCFTGKNYDIHSINNPTGHCAYCGVKIYDEKQLESIASELTKLKGHRLQGNIIKVTDKLNNAKNSEELSYAKRKQNSEEIEFFKKFLTISENKPYMDGSDILKDYFKIKEKDQQTTLKRYLRPISRTIDHISPQKLNEENKHSDINLVEACYCCNHDLKKGMSFNDFYTTYPSIKENMPHDKFQYAHSNLLSESKESVENRMSATTLSNYIENLFSQRTNLTNQILTIDYRLKKAKEAISGNISACESKIKSKKEEIKAYTEKLNELSEDKKFNAMLRKKHIEEEIKHNESIIESLIYHKNNTQDKISEIQNPSKNSKKQNKDSLLSELNDSVKGTNQEIEKYRKKIEELNKESKEIDKNFPSIDILKERKRKIEKTYALHKELINEEELYAKITTEIIRLSEQIKLIQKRIEELAKEDFNIENYSNEEKDNYIRYQDLTKALAFIDSHSQTGIKEFIQQEAKEKIEEELKDASKSKIINDYIENEEKIKLEKTLKNYIEKENELNKKLENTKNQIKALRIKTKDINIEQLEIESLEVEQEIKSYETKIMYLKYPSIIEKINAEITLLNKTIDDLKQKEKDIDNILNS